jgi:hypothetical protein
MSTLQLKHPSLYVANITSSMLHSLTSKQVGQGRFQTAAVVQLRDPLPATEQEIQSIKESIWLNISAANFQAPAHAQIHKDYIMFASDDKPFILAGKETVLRAMTVKLYESEINDHFATQELLRASEAACIDMQSLESTREGIHDLLCEILGLKTLGGNDDIFAAGLDSLSIFRIVASLRATFQASGKAQDDLSAVSIGTISTNPTIEKLSNTLYKIFHTGYSDGAAEDDDFMRELLAKYTATLPERARPQNSNAAGGGVSVILTGSTGSLGSYLLDTLLSNRHIARVTCLNRAPDGRERQSKGNKARGLPADWPSERAQFIYADLSKPNLGLDVETYSKMVKETTHIIRKYRNSTFMCKS